MKRLLILAVLLLPGCTTFESETISAATNAGFTDVVPGNLDFFACSESDKTGRKFVGTNVQGQRVQGTVCCGTFKRCTVRF